MRRNHWIFLAAVLLTAAALRLMLLGSKSFWLDEALSVTLSSKPFAELWQRLGAVPEPHPPLYYNLLHFWMPLVGRSETAVRLPSALISLVNVALVYGLGRRLFSRQVGLVAAALLAVSPLAIWYGQEARMYAFVTSAGLVTALLLTWTSWWACLPLAAAMTVGLYLDYTYIPLLIVLSTIWIWRWWHLGREPKPLLVWLTALGISAVAYLPWLKHLLHLLGQLDRIFIFETLIAWLNLPKLPPAVYLTGLMVLAVATWIGCVLLAKLLHDERTRRLLVPIIIAGFTLLLILFALPRGFALKKLLLLGWPYAVLLVAALLVSLGRDRLTQAILLIGLTASLLMIQFVPKDDWRGVAAHLNANAGDSAEVWVHPSWDGVPLMVYQTAIPIKRGDLDRLKNSDGSDLWYVAERFPGQPIPNYPHEIWLDETHTIVETIPFYRLELRHYKKK